MKANTLAVEAMTMIPEITEKLQEASQIQDSGGGGLLLYVGIVASIFVAAILAKPISQGIRWCRWKDSAGGIDLNTSIRQFQRANEWSDSAVNYGLRAQGSEGLAKPWAYVKAMLAGARGAWAMSVLTRVSEKEYALAKDGEIIGSGTIIGMSDQAKFQAVMDADEKKYGVLQRNMLPKHWNMLYEMAHNARQLGKSVDHKLMLNQFMAQRSHLVGWRGSIWVSVHKKLGWEGLMTWKIVAPTALAVVMWFGAFELLFSTAGSVWQEVRSLWGG